MTGYKSVYYLLAMPRRLGDTQRLFTYLPFGWFFSRIAQNVTGGFGSNLHGR